MSLPSHHEQVSLLESAFAYSHEGMILTDVNSNIITINAAFSKMTGYKKETLIGKNPRIMKSGFHDIKFYKEMWKSVKDKGFWQGEVWDRSKNGEISPRNLQIKPITDKANNVVFYLGLMIDHSKLNEMTKLANQDALTGLPNRRLFEKRLEHDVAHAKRNNSLLSLLYIDLDRFKHINDSCGHRIGDELLIQVAQRLLKSIRAEDTAARLGGDEFMIILSEVKSIPDIKQVSQKILNNISKPFYIDDHIINISCSIGFSVFPDHSENITSLINKADNSMYHAKEAGRNTFC